MFQCANCGGNLRFDIPTQKLLCDYCQSEYDCYDVSEHDNAGTSESYQVNVFTCPQCGGEIIGTDQSAAEFCSYCGSSVVLEKKLRDEKRPSKIIPFQKTKEDCKKAYTKELRRALFAPK